MKLVNVSTLLITLLLIACGDNASVNNSAHTENNESISYDQTTTEDNTQYSSDEQAEIVDSNPVAINGVNFDPPPRPASQLYRRFGGRQKRYAAMINQISHRYGVEPYLTHAIISQESAYRPTVGSSVGAKGLMQLMPAAGRRFGCTNRTDPKCNVQAGVKYLKYLARYFGGRGNLQTIAAGYNAGEAAAMSYLKGTRLKGKNPLGRRTPNGVPVASFALSKKQRASCSGKANKNPVPRCEGQTYHYARNVAGYYLHYKRNPQIIGLISSSRRASTCMERDLC
ncbi:MAG: transglycosylase SLT domain-containing protein [Gammaproteobacteria bacterium]|nr:transglycosylase SLT domain-containing protein [Gammaproteobacteria bacterium]